MRDCAAVWKGFFLRLLLSRSHKFSCKSFTSFFSSSSGFFFFVLVYTFFLWWIIMQKCFSPSCCPDDEKIHKKCDSNFSWINLTFFLFCLLGGIVDESKDKNLILWAFEMKILIRKGTRQFRIHRFHISSLWSFKGCSTS